MPGARFEHDFTDDAGNLLVGNITVQVARENGGPVQCYSDRELTTGLGSTFVNVGGKVAFFAAGGALRVTVTQGLFSRTLRYYALGLAAETDFTFAQNAGVWSAVTTYARGEYVVRNGVGIFISLVDGNLNHTPDSSTPGSTAYWTYYPGVLGPEGPTGPDGEQGPAGNDGADGTNGTDGADGTNGADGADGTDPGVLLTWDDVNTDADPGAGNIRADNDTLSLATVLYVSKTNRAGDNIAPFLAALDDSSSTVKGQVTLTRSGGNAQAGFKITGITDATGYVKVAVSGHWGATGFIDGNAISFQFDQTGDKGADGLGAGDVIGPAGAVNNRVAVFDGTTGKLIKDSGVSLGGAASLNVGTTAGTVAAGDDSRITGAAPQATTYTKSEVDGLVTTTAAGVAKRGTVRVATTANVTISTALNNGDSLDGVTLATGDLVLVKNQSTGSQNGIYVVGASPARASEFDTYNEHPGALIVVQEGTVNADSFWYCTSNTGGTLGSTAIVFAQLSLTPPDDSVTNAKLANMATATIKGRTTAGTGDPEDLSATQARGVLGLATSDSPQLAGIELGHATDTTITRTAAGRIAVEGVAVTLSNDVREKLTANRTYYVATTGSDSNSGLAVGTPFLTIQKALDVAASLDFGGFAITIQIADGTYSSGFTIPILVGQSGADKLILNGNSTTPTNVNITGTINVPKGALVTAQYFRPAVAGGTSISISGGVFNFQNLTFGAASTQIFCENGGVVRAIGSAYAINGAAGSHWWARNGGVIICDFQTVTITGTPAFTDFAFTQQGTILCGVMTFSGTATGRRYNSTLAGVINSAGGGASALPGSTAGTTATGGQYA